LFITSDPGAAVKEQRVDCLNRHLKSSMTQLLEGFAMAIPTGIFENNGYLLNRQPFKTYKSGAYSFKKAAA